VSLTDRQLACLRHAADGKSVEHTAIALNVSESTAKKEFRAIRRKLRARTTAQAVAIGYRTGLLSGGTGDEIAMLRLAHGMGYRIALVAMEGA
jgi:DNA-binding CsgD family transcriptional regulator